ncbi:hypothetical protein [Nocardiopsis sp. FIRDI 009]|uniref:hypothetical protein n=1 Tax=Nocardiopsis sp. FIRDI 009 TaxID=714197 RepID=UPI000E284A80|nr:hypothetical protein [Nocardiopsis sp. FIRDI 009]
MSETHTGDWWYCLKHMRVEQGPGCPNRERMGPYETEATAARALAIAAERNEEWEAEDER